jgi:hypothetical protein
MDIEKERMSLLARREIEARMAVPLLEAFAREVGEQLAKKSLRSYSIFGKTERPTVLNSSEAQPC